MAGPHNWLDVDGDLNNTANWSTGLVPATGETVRFLSGDNTITTNTNWSAKNNMLIEVGPDFEGYLGSSSNKFQLGTGATIRFNGLRTKAAWFDPDGGTGTVYDSSTYPSALNFTGTMSTIYVAKAKACNLLGGLSLTNVYTEGSNVTLTLESGISLTNAYINGGIISCSGAVTNVYITEGVWTHEGDTYYNISLLETRGPNAAFKWNAPATITTVKGFAGLIDASATAVAKVATNSEVHRGCILNFDTGIDTFTTTNACGIYGGRLIGGPSVTSTVYLPYGSGSAN